MIATVRLYYNTGFNTKNIPDSPNLLNGSSFTHADFSSTYELQNNFIRSCTIEASWDDVKNADYLRLNNAYFFIISVNMLNERVAELILQIDALTTLGGPASLTYSGGIMNRAHALTDTLFENCIEEDITPLKPLEVVASSYHGDSDPAQDSAVTIVGSTISLSQPTVTISNGHLDLSPDAQTAYTFQGPIGGQDYQVTLPETPPAAPTTVIRIAGHKGTIPGVGLYPLYDVLPNIRYLRMLNLTGAILYCYQLPLSYMGINFVDLHADNTNKTISPETITMTVSGLPPFERADYTPRNKKVFAINATYRIYFNVSGDMQIIDASRLRGTGLTSPTLTMIADPQVGGGFYARFSNVDNNPTSPNQYCIKGAPWKTTPIAFTGAGGEWFNNNDYIINKNNATNEYWKEYGNWGGISSIMQGASAGMIGGVGGMLAGGLIGGAGALGTRLQEGLSGGAKLNNQLNELSYNLQKTKIVYPELSTTPMAGLANCYKELLTVDYIGPAVSDLQRFDKYFDLYGYAMGGQAFDKAYLSGRQYCNYIQCSDVHIVSDNNNFGLATKNEAERQLNDGIRIWHVKPRAITSNPIV